MATFRRTSEKFAVKVAFAVVEAVVGLAVVVERDMVKEGEVVHEENW